MTPLVMSAALLGQCLLGSMTTLGPRAAAQQPPPYSELEVKAAYLLNFTRYVDWPEDAFETVESPIVVCVHGHDPFGPTLDAVLDGRRSAGRPLEIQRTQHSSALAGCHLVYLSRREGQRLDETLSATDDRPVLTVGETQGFLKAGGAIGLFLSPEATVQFEVNLDATQAARLQVSSRMLALARSVSQSHERANP